MKRRKHRVRLLARQKLVQRQYVICGLITREPKRRSPTGYEPNLRLCCGHGVTTRREDGFCYREASFTRKLWLSQKRDRRDHAAREEGLNDVRGASIAIFRLEERHDDAGPACARRPPRAVQVAA